MSDGSGFQWVEFVPPKRLGIEPAYGWAALDKLREEPGRWAKLHRYQSKSGAASAAAGLRKKGFDAEPRIEDDGSSTLYACWPGGPVAATLPTPIRPAAGKPVAKAVGYPCDHCDQEMDTPGGLKHHVRRHHPDAAA